MGSLKVGILGCGSIALRRHLPEYAANDDVEIIAVCDTLEDRAKEVAKLYDAKAYTDYQQLIADDEIDAVSVCLPNYLHAPATTLALEAGKHVLCEKPMAITLEEAEKMIAVAKKTNKKLMIAQNQRFVASHEKARQLIQSGEVGEIYSFRTVFGHSGPEDWSIDGRNSWFFNEKEAFIGAMGDLGVHKIDLIRYLLNEEIVEVAGFVETRAKKDTTVDDNAVSIFKTESGIVGTMAASWSYNATQDNSTIIYGEHAILRLEDDPNYSLIVHYTNGETAKYELGAIQTNDEGGQHTSHVIDHFVDALVHGKDVSVPGIEGMKSLQVVLAVLESNKSKTVVNLG